MKISAHPLTLVRTTDACKKCSYRFFKNTAISNVTDVKEPNIDGIAKFVVYVG